MIIKYQSLQTSLTKNILPLYILTGLDDFLLNDAAEKVKNIWFKAHTSEKQVIHIENTDDWYNMLDAANSYSLFNEHILLDVRFDKKLLAKEALNIIKQYLANINPKCLLIMRLPNIPTKSLGKLSSDPNIGHIQIYPFKPYEQRNWINTALKNKNIKFNNDVVDIIMHYTEGNLLASFQIINVLTLIMTDERQLTAEITHEFLIEQTQFSLYELRDACLTQNPANILRLLKQFENNKFEPQLILWILSQEIRNLINLKYLLKTDDINKACSKLKIWPSHVKFYQQILNNLTLTNLFKLLTRIQEIDFKIKTSQHSLLAIEFERLAMLLINKDTCFA